MTKNSFAELGLSKKVMEAVTAAGYTTPTPIQAGAIPVAVTGQDVLGIAQTGTGKTAAFVLPLLCRLERGRARARMPRSLILAPTRELAAQVAEAFESLGTNQKVSMALLIGGVSFTEQLKKLDRGVDVLIATPGRLLDHFSRGKILLTGVEVLVIDEADRMLDMGFIPDIEKICKLLPPRRQTLFFSATMPNEITRLAGQFLKDPARIEVAPPATTAKTITQRFRFLPDGTDWVKREILREMIREQEDLQNAIIFCNRKRDVAILLKSLQKHGFNAGALHGDMDQTARMATLAAFRSGETNILAASDVAARGLDIPEVSHVFNYDMPWQSDDYVHRIGRTGRAGRKGYAAALVTADDLKIVKELEKMAGEPVEWIGEPPGEDAESQAKGRGRGRGRGGRSATKKPASRRGEQRHRAKAPGDTEAPLAPEATSEVSEVKHDARAPEMASSGAGEGKAERKTGSRRRRSSRGRAEGTAREQETVAAETKSPDDSKPAAAASETSDGERRNSRRRSGSGDKPKGEARAPRDGDRKRGGTKTAASSGKKKGKKVEGAPQGLSDNVPAFLQRSVR